MGRWEVSLHSWQRGANPLISWRPPTLPMSPSFFKILSKNPPPTPTSRSPPTLTPTALYLVMFLWLNKWSCHIWLMCYFTYYLIIWVYTCQASLPKYEKDLDVCFMQQGVSFTAFGHIRFFSGTLIWYHTQKHTEHTQEPVDWHTHMNIYLHHLLCAHSSYLFYIKWLNE